jgi:signal transduction histidine kinase
VQEAIDSACEGGREYCIEYRVRRADGGIRWVHSRGRPCNGANGHAGQLRGVCVDITDLKWADGRRAFTHDECHLIERAEPVLGALSELVPALPQELADQLAGSLRRMRTIIRQVNAMNQAMRRWFRQSTHETGWLRRDQLQLCHDDVSAWFAEATWLILDDAIDVRADFQVPGEPFWANLDGVLAALRNLQTNAVEALGRKDRPPYRVVFSARIRRLQETEVDGVNPEYVVLSAADTGDGVPCKVRAQLFEGLVGRDADRGLGSKIVRSVVDDHKGLIRVATRKGVGTLVELWFPRLVDPDARPLRVQWRPYEEARKHGGVVRRVGAEGLLAALSDHPTQTDRH